MNRLQAELQRLYAPAGGGVRAMVLEVTGPGGWDALAAVWRGVQADLDLPAPAIAVSGTDSLQLWFSLAEPVSENQAQDVLQALRARYLAGTPPDRVRARPSPPGTTVGAPPVQVGPERWSAFIAADLAPLFSSEPWLDHPPGVDAQADLLARISCTGTAAFRTARARLQPPPDAPAPAPAAAPAAYGSGLEPAQFLRAVMNDAQAPLALRIEAAKALLLREGRDR